MQVAGTGVVGRRAGRYVLYDPIASGGMATVHFGRMLGPVGFTRTVAIKRLHAHLARDPEFVAMFLDEARLAARVQHPNVIATLDIVTTGGEVFLVMDYVKGESLSGLLRTTRASFDDAAPSSVAHAPPAVLTSILGGILHGLHAAHEATTDRGEPLEIIHRDVSPQNILVGEDGVARLADFGVAKAQWRAQSTQGEKIKGKLSYMAPEQLERKKLDHRVDVYAASVVLWESLTGRRLFTGDNPGIILHEILRAEVPPPSHFAPSIPPALDRVVLQGLSRAADDRFPTALQMAIELERALPPAPQSVVSEWVRSTAGLVLEQRAQRLAAIEATPAGEPVPSASPGDPVPVTMGSAETIRHLSNAPTRPEMLLADVAPLVRPATEATDVSDVTDVSEAPGRELSSVSLSGEVRPVAPRSRARARVMTAAAAALVAALSFVAFHRLVPPTAAPATAAAGSSTPSSPTAPPATSVPPASRVLGDPTSLPAGDDALPAVSAVPATAAAPVPSASSSSRPRGVSPPARPVSASGKRNCDPPYTLDPSSVSSDGKPLKRFKPWCL